jgi:hypothetical protein
MGRQITVNKLRSLATQLGRVSLVFTVIALQGCDPISLTAMGIGASTGVQHTLTGISYRTFAVPMPRVRSAVMTTFDRMGIEMGGKEPIENGERLTARAADREIEVELEALTPKMTRMRTTAKNGLFRDASTATEIILQTERVLGGV